MTEVPSGTVTERPSISSVTAALLSLAGDRRVGFLVRDVDRVEVEIGRVLPSQVQHLAPNMWDYAHPNVGPYIEDKIVERFTTVRDYSGKAPGKSISLSLK